MYTKVFTKKQPHYKEDQLPLSPASRCLASWGSGRPGPSYQYGKGAGELETMEYLEFIARLTSRIPDKGQLMVRYFGLYANAHRGKIRKAGISPIALRMVEREKNSSRVFRTIFRSFATMRRPGGILRGPFYILDFDPRPGISFFRDGRYRFRAYGEKTSCSVKKQIPIIKWSSPSWMGRRAGPM
jgi:hypothetical protein